MKKKVKRFTESFFEIVENALFSLLGFSLGGLLFYLFSTAVSSWL